MKNSLRFVFVALAVSSASFSALGEENGESAQSLGTWVTSSWTGGFTPSDYNILRGLVPSPATGLDQREGVTQDYKGLTDGVAIATDRTKTTALIDNASITYTLAKAIRIDEVRVYATWGGPARAGVSIKSVEIVTCSGEIVTIGGECNYCSSAANLAVLKMQDGSPLCTDASKITVNFGTQYPAGNPGGYNGYAELEVVSRSVDPIPVWETGSWHSGFTPASSDENLILGKEPTYISSGAIVNGNEWSADCKVLTDGKAEKNLEDKKNVTAFYSNASITYTLSEEDVCVINEVRIYSTSKSVYRDELSIDSICVETQAGAVFTLPCSSVVHYDPFNSGGCPYAILKRNDGSPLFSNAKKITFVFGQQKSSFVPYAELEVLGYESVDPKLELKVIGGSKKQVFNSKFCLEASLAGLENASYDWDLDGDMIFEIIGGGSDKEVSFSSPGIKEIYVREKTTGQKEGIRISACFKSVYLTADKPEDNSDGIYPYDTPEKAVYNHDIVWPLVGAGTTVHLLPGSYNHSFVVEEGVKVLAVDPSHGATVVTNDGSKRVFEVSGSGAMISGLTISGGGLVKPNNWDETKSFEKAEEIPGGACVYVHDGGIVSNCWITNPNCNLSGGAGGCVYNDNGRVVDCLIGNSDHSTKIFYGTGIYQKGANALMERCVITNVVMNGPYYSQYKIGGAIQMTGGTVRNCLIADCHFKGGSYVDKAARDRTPGVFAGGGRIENCTITKNSAPLMTSGIVIDGYGVEVVNSIIYGNESTENNSPHDAYVFSGDNVVFSHCCVRSPISGAYSGVDNISSNPLFVDVLNGDYTLKKDSPCRNAADRLLYTGKSNDRDLSRKPRFQGEDLDIGCYEYPVKSFMVIVR